MCVTLRGLYSITPWIDRQSQDTYSTANNLGQVRYKQSNVHANSMGKEQLLATVLSSIRHTNVHK